MESDSAREQFSRLRSQVSYLYQSGTAVMGRIDEAIKSSVFQAMEVQIASHNASQIYQRAQVTRTGARSSVSRTYHLNRNAQRMLQVVRNFDTESLRAQASAATTLSLIPSLRNITHRIMREVSIVNESSASVLSTASEAWQLGRSVYNLSVSEKKVRFTLVFFLCFLLDNAIHHSIFVYTTACSSTPQSSLDLCLFLRWWPSRQACQL